MGKYIVRKHVLNQEGEEIRHEDYLDQFDTPERAESFRQSKEAKYQQTLDDFIEDGMPLSQISERRSFEVVRLE